MKLCVYTCITGNYDSIKEIEDLNLNEKIDFICYTNNKKLKSRTWKVVYVEDDKLTNVQLARKIKILGTEELRDYDITVWMDGDIQWKTPIRDFIKKYVDLKTYDLVGFKHWERKSVAEELLANYEIEKIGVEEALKIQNFYKETDFKDDNGLIETTVLFRDFNNKRLQKAMDKWFDFIVNLTHRDQLSFNYVEYLTGFTYYKHSKYINAYVYYKKRNTYDLDVTEIKNINEKNKIHITPKFDTKAIRIKFDSKFGLVVKNIKCKEATSINTNCMDVDGDKYCSYCPLVIELNGSFKKGEKIDLAFDLELYNVFELTHKVASQKNRIENIDEEVKALKDEALRYQELARQCREELDNVMNSKSMKITKPLRDLTALISRKKNK